MLPDFPLGKPAGYVEIFSSFLPSRSRINEEYSRWVMLVQLEPIRRSRNAMREGNSVVFCIAYLVVTLIWMNCRPVGSSAMAVLAVAVTFS